jgi:NAD(P)-dependent dehydrogenase (short-subunit alcohol dehydrogenase family)
MPSSAPSVLITGATRGIGLATARVLAQRNARLTLAVRDVHKGEAVAAELRRSNPTLSIEVMALDLASLESVRAFASAYRATGKPLHVLVNNAGPMNAPNYRALTKQGFELQLGVNHLGHSLLTRLLLPVLETSAPSRIITIASERHRRVGAFDLDALERDPSFLPTEPYDRSKLANLWFTYALARRLHGRDIAVIAACPGFVPDTIAATRQGLGKLLFKVLERMPFARRPEVSANELARLVLEPEFQTERSAYYSSGKRATSSPLSHDEAAQERLWQISARLVGLEP